MLKTKSKIKAKPGLKTESGLKTKPNAWKSIAGKLMDKKTIAKLREHIRLKHIGLREHALLKQIKLNTSCSH